MSDELQEQLQEQSQDQPQENNLSLKNEIKDELREEFKNFRHKRKRRVFYSVGIFVLGLAIGFGGGIAAHFDHHAGHGHEQVQKWNHIQMKNFHKR